MIDPDVLEAVKELPDDFWVFAEFRIEHAGRNVSRNVDWFIVRQVPEGSEHRSTLILTELKHVAKPLRGDINGTWEQLTDLGEWREIEPSNEHDINHYWQAVNTANTLADWLWNNQRRYREGPDRPSRDFKLWADLLLLSPPTTRHQLPLKPRYGSFWYRIEDWLYHIMSWDPERGLPLTERELYNLADVLGLKLIYEGASSNPPAPVEPRPEPRIQPFSSPGEPQQFVTWLGSLVDRLHGLEERVASLELEIDRVNRAARTPFPAPVVALPTARESLSAEEREALIDAVVAVRSLGKSRALPGIVLDLNRLLGYNLKDTAYNGFGNARAMFDQARQEGIIQYGPYSGPNPTIYLVDETIGGGDSIAL